MIASQSLGSVLALVNVKDAKFDTSVTSNKICSGLRRGRFKGNNLPEYYDLIRSQEYFIHERKTRIIL
jgi:hypothetical protein